jgi:hypothetical protein
MKIENVPALAQPELDNRVGGRAKAKLPAKIVFGGKQFVLDCTIRDLSAGGARLAVPAADILPDDVILIEPQSMLAFDSRVQWRRKSLAGLSFKKAVSLDDPSNPDTKVLRMYALDARLAWGL